MEEPAIVTPTPPPKPQNILVEIVLPDTKTLDLGHLPLSMPIIEIKRKILTTTTIAIN